MNKVAGILKDYYFDSKKTYVCKRGNKKYTVAYFKDLKHNRVFIENKSKSLKTLNLLGEKVYVKDMTKDGKFAWLIDKDGDQLLRHIKIGDDAIPAMFNGERAFVNGFNYVDDETYLYIKFPNTKGDGFFPVLFDEKKKNLKIGIYKGKKYLVRKTNSGNIILLDRDGKTVGLSKPEEVDFE